MKNIFFLPKPQPGDIELQEIINLLKASGCEEDKDFFVSREVSRGADWGELQFDIGLHEVIDNYGDAIATTYYTNPDKQPYFADPLLFTKEGKDFEDLVDSIMAASDSLAQSDFWWIVENCKTADELEASVNAYNQDEEGNHWAKVSIQRYDDGGFTLSYSTVSRTNQVEMHCHDGECYLVYRVDSSHSIDTSSIVKACLKEGFEPHFTAHDVFFNKLYPLIFEEEVCQFRFKPDDIKCFDYYMPRFGVEWSGLDSPMPSVSHAWYFEEQDTALRIANISLEYAEIIKASAESKLRDFEQNPPYFPSVPYRDWETIYQPEESPLPQEFDNVKQALQTISEECTRIIQEFKNGERDVPPAEPTTLITFGIEPSEKAKGLEGICVNCSSLTEVAAVLGVSLTPEQQLIAAYSRGGMPETIKVGHELGMDDAAITKTANKVILDSMRAHAGITPEIDEQTLNAIHAGVETPLGILYVDLPHNSGMLPSHVEAAGAPNGILAMNRNPETHEIEGFSFYGPEQMAKRWAHHVDGYIAAVSNSCSHHNIYGPIYEDVREAIDARINEARQYDDVHVIDLRGIELDPELTVLYTAPAFGGAPTVIIGDDFVSYFGNDNVARDVYSSADWEARWGNPPWQHWTMMDHGPGYAIVCSDDAQELRDVLLFICERADIRTHTADEIINNTPGQDEENLGE